MKFIADVNVAQFIIKQLCLDGHSVIDIKKEELSIEDKNIIHLALQDKHIIITHDKDFEVLTKYPKYRAGTIIIRLVQANAQYFYKRLTEVLNHKTEDELLKSLTIITESGFEIYPYK